MMHPVAWVGAWVGLRGISQAATASLLAAVWQGILLAAAAWLGLRLLPKTPAAVRFAIWFGVFLLVAALPVIALWPKAGGVARSGGGPWLSLDSRWSLAIAAVWAGASLLRAATLAVAAFRVRALWKRAQPVELNGPFPTDRVETTTNPRTVISTEAKRSGETCNCTATTLSDSILKRARRAEVCVSDEVDRPSVIGFFAPKTLIPRWLLERLTPAELEQIVLHEAGHLRRADDWMNLLQKLALVVFPLNPALAWIERRLCFERELACDEQVLRDSAQQAGASTAYAACLVALAEYRMGRRGLTPGLALGFWGTLGRESELAQRVGRILAGGGKMKAAHARLVLGGAMLALVAGAVELPRCPQVIGFSSNSSADSYSAASPAGDTSGRGMAGFRAESVVFRPAEGNGIVSTDHDGSAGPGLCPIHRSRIAMSGVLPQHQVVAQRQPTLRDETAKDGPPRLVASEPRAGNWVMVTTWDGAEVSRVVLTSSEAPDVGSAARQEQVPAERRVYEQRIYRYAAVPVRGGWLVIQL